MTRARTWGIVGGLLALLASHGAAAQYCPCYTASSPNNSHDCGVEAVNGTNPSPAEWAGIFDLVSRGPSAWGDQGPTVGDIGQGCGKPEPIHSVPARFPCELLKSIAMVESGWRQFCVPTTPGDQVGGASRTIISFDCGYGIGQVTSGMHAGETPDFDRQRVASDPTYNLATGTRILAGKWIATNCVGDNQPTVIEDWYTATWAYNGLAYVNNPNNPNYDSNRGVYDPDNDAHACPYQERVFGRVEHPTNGYWPSVALAYPDPADCGGSGSPPDLPEPHCASPTDCGATRSVHVTSCIDNPGTGGAGGAASSTNGSGGAAIAASTSTASGTTGVGGRSGSADVDGDLHGTCACRTTGSEPDSPLPFVAAVGLVFVLVTRRRPMRT
ncbi:MAG: MYXO-CTERM sorting domain-containing protein [Polyangiaceae bacterium]